MTVEAGGGGNQNSGVASSGSAAAAAASSSVDLQLEDRLRISDPMMQPPLAPPSGSANNLLSSSTTSSNMSSAKNNNKKKAAPKKASRSSSSGTSAKYNVKARDPKRDTSVPFDEMKRLMRVYGSLKCLRNRTPVDSGRAPAKMESIKRKFYRWFPDLEDRFVRTPEGWYNPRAGHEEEMRYREAMRKKDQDSLVRKRNSRRSSSKLKTGGAV